MSILDPSTAALTMLTEDPFFDEGQVAAAAFLARYSDRTRCPSPGCTDRSPTRRSEDHDDL